MALVKTTVRGLFLLLPVEAQKDRYEIWKTTGYKLSITACSCRGAVVACFALCSQLYMLSSFHRLNVIEGQNRVLEFELETHTAVVNLLNETCQKVGVGPLIVFDAYGNVCQLQFSMRWRSRRSK